VSLSREQMMELMQLADGELDGDEAARARVEELVRASEEARQVLEAMGGLGDVVREGAAAGEGFAAADGIADEVMGAIAAGHGAPEGVAGRVVPLAAARRAREGVAAAVVTVLALAAGALLVFKGPGPSRVAEAPIDVAPSGSARPLEAAPASALAQAASPAAGGAGVDLEEARSKENKLDVFFVPSSDGANAATSVVVWIDDHGSGGH